MKLEWVVLAEGMGGDASGALTLIGVNRNVFVAQALPAVTKRAVLVHVAGDAGTLEPGAQAQVSFSVVSPSGRVLLAQSSGITLAPPIWSDLPAGIDIPAEFGLNVTEYGDHVIKVEIDLGGDRLTGEVMLYVRTPPSGEPRPAT